MKCVMCEKRQTRRYLLGASEWYLEAQGHHPNQEDQDAPGDPGGQKQRDYPTNLSTNTCGKRKGVIVLSSVNVQMWRRTLTFMAVKIATTTKEQEWF